MEYGTVMYSTLRDQLVRLGVPQRTGQFVRLFRSAVRSGRIDAAFLPDRFTPAEVFPDRAVGLDGRAIRDLIVKVTPAYEAWFETTRAALRRSGRRAHVTAEQIASGEVDFGALVERTRAQLNAAEARRQRAAVNRRAAAARARRAGQGRGRPKTS